MPSNWKHSSAPMSTPAYLTRGLSRQSFSVACPGSATLEAALPDNVGWVAHWCTVAHKICEDCRKNGGKGAALKAGFEASRGEWVMLLDGDLDIHPKQTPYFFEAAANSGADIVCGSKRHRRSVVQYPWHRRLVSALYFALVRAFVGLPITDTQTGRTSFSPHSWKQTARCS